MKTTLWKWMRLHNVSPRELAQRLGVYDSQCYRWMKRLNAPSGPTCQRIREALSIPADVEVEWKGKTMAVSELANLLYDASRDIQSVARVCSLAATSISGHVMGCGVDAETKERIPENLLRQLQSVGLPVLHAMDWDEAKYEALRHALALEQAT